MNNFENISILDYYFNVNEDHFNDFEYSNYNPYYKFSLSKKLIEISRGLAFLNRIKRWIAVHEIS